MSVVVVMMSLLSVVPVMRFGDVNGGDDVSSGGDGVSVGADVSGDVEVSGDGGEVW